VSTRAWTDREVREALGVAPVDAAARAVFAGVSTDSRKIEAGDLYVALVGDRFDGHDFVEDALAKGARGAVVSRAPVVAASTPLYRVEDTLVALGALAAFRRRSLRAPVVAITGSSGKTTTKDLAAAAVGSAKRVHATRGNLNNRVGMPLTLLATPAEAEAVVLELGTNEPGEIRTLAQISRPDIGVVTTVGEAHLEKLGSLEGVLDEKLDLLRGLAAGGRCVVGDEPEVLAARARAICTGVRVAGWSARADADLRPLDARADAAARYSFRWRGERVEVPFVGRHAAADALLALAIADLLGVSPADAARGIAIATTQAMRGEVRRVGGLTLIVDCYNANPQSVRAALDLLEGQLAKRRVAVLGTMRELGTESERLHREVLANALVRKVDLVVATGAFAAAAESLGPAAAGVITAPDWQAAYPRLRERLAGDEIVLLKASRGIAMEGMLPLFERDFRGAPAVGEGSR
jgi:UDP-N-acetylmuramoyl-tripeptide--D-alanyl-D-alanine ligase